MTQNHPGVGFEDIDEFALDDPTLTDRLPEWLSEEADPARAQPPHKTAGRPLLIGLIAFAIGWLAAALVRVSWEKKLRPAT